MQPPYQPPIPVPDGSAPGGYTPPTGPAKVNFDVIGRAWETLKPNMAIWIGAFAIYIVISSGFSFAIGLLSGGGARPIPGPDGMPASMPTPNLGLMFIGYLVQFVVTQFLISGLYRMAINQVRTGRAELGDMFSVVDVLPAVLIAAFLSTLAMFVGILLCIIPGLLLAGLLMFTTPLIVDKRMGAIDAITTSFNTLKPEMGMAALFVIVIGLLASVGVIACFVGILVTGPLAILSMATLYRDFFPQPAAL